MGTKTQTELEKRIEEAAYSYEGPSHFNCYSCCQSDSDYEKAFKAGAKFILEMPEVKEAAKCFDQAIRQWEMHASFHEEDWSDDENIERIELERCREALSKLRAMGVV